MMKKILLLWDCTFFTTIGLVGLFEDQHGIMSKIFLLMKTLVLQGLLVSIVNFLSKKRKPCCQMMLKNGRLQCKLIWIVM